MDWLLLGLIVAFVLWVFQMIIVLPQADRTAWRPDPPGSDEYRGGLSPG